MKSKQKAVIFGAGDMTARWLNETDLSNIDIIAFADNDKRLWGRPLYGIANVIDPSSLNGLDYDRIIVCTSINKEVKAIITTQLIDCGASKDKISYFPDKFSVDYHPRMLFFRSFAKEVRDSGISGDIAECGVWNGETAKYINRYFYDRKLYLFDTFEGYPEQSLSYDRTFNEFSESTLNKQQTMFYSPEYVMQKMTFPENVIIKQGWFPESAEGVNGLFCMVHIDFTLYQPTFDAVNLFWEKMSSGGAVIVRDYYSNIFPGVKQAVSEFEINLGKRITKAPLGDTSCIILIKE